MPANLIRPGWPAPSKVHAVTTTRVGGHSQGVFAQFNLASHVGDAADAVAANRQQLMRELQLPSPPLWLNQVHGEKVIAATDWQMAIPADGCYADQPGQVCAVLTADCLPVLLCARHGDEVAIVHAGWRGLAAGVIEAALNKFRTPAAELLAWLGPAIGPQAFEVGDEVRAAFMQHDAAAESAFTPGRDGHWLADIYALARQRLHAMGCTAIYGGGECTYRDAQRFYSYRRDGKTGRMASLIWIASDN